MIKLENAFNLFVFAGKER